MRLFLRDLVKKYYEKTGVVSTGIMLLATKTQDKEFLEYITKELRIAYSVECIPGPTVDTY